MQVIKAGYEIIDMDNPLEKVERVARVCYKSEDKIKAGSAEKMVRALIKSNHTAMIEHSSLIIGVDKEEYDLLGLQVNYLEQCYGFKSYLRFTRYVRLDGKYLVSGNLRAWREFLQQCEEYLFSISTALYKIIRSDKYRVFFEGIECTVYGDGSAVEVDPDSLTSREKLIHKDLTVKFIVDRGVSHEIVRHRVASFAQESTRYCNYGSKAGEITVIEPCYLSAGIAPIDNWGIKYRAWESACMVAEESYLLMLDAGATPQEARAVLPNSLKTEIVMTANLKEWVHFLNLRACGSTGKPHPQMLEVAVPLLKELKTVIPTVFDDLEPMEVK